MLRVTEIFILFLKKLNLMVRVRRSLVTRLLSKLGPELSKRTHHSTHEKTGFEEQSAVHKYPLTVTGNHLQVRQSTQYVVDSRIKLISWHTHTSCLTAYRLPQPTDDE